MTTNKQDNLNPTNSTGLESISIHHNPSKQDELQEKCRKAQVLMQMQDDEFERVFGNKKGLYGLVTSEVLSVLEELESKMMLQSLSSNSSDYVAFHAENQSAIQTLKEKYK